MPRSTADRLMRVRYTSRSGTKWLVPHPTANSSTPTRTTAPVCIFGEGSDIERGDLTARGRFVQSAGAAGSERGPFFSFRPPRAEGSGRWTFICRALLGQLEA